MTETTNFGLKKPEETDFYSVDTQNDNMDAIDSVLQEFKDGTQQVGDSARLGGKDASEYALGTDLIPYKGETLGTSILEKALSYTEDGIYNYRLLGGSYIGTDLPNNDYKNGQATVITRVASGNKYGTTVILWGANNSSYVQRIAVNYYGSSGWTGWKEFATLTDLAKYLPLTANTQQTLKIANKYALQLNNSIADATEVYLALTGAKTLGFFGCSDENKPVFRNSSGINTDILHTGNKPSGSYTGNGSATERIINIGGIGSAVILYSSLKRRMAIVTRGLTLCVDENGAVTADFGTDLLDMSTSLKLSIASTHVCLNENGTAYGYLVV